jgi:uncharacterized protein (TIGR00304 family)
MRYEIGGMLIAAGVFLVMLSLMQSATEGKAGQGNKGQENIGYGGVILIGPIPIVFGSSQKTASTAVLLSIALMVISFLLLRRSG